MILKPFVLLALLTAVSAQNLFLTGESGRQVGSNQHSQVATEEGGILLQDTYALEKLRRFNTERIPERVAHPHGIGAHGFFRTTRGVSSLTAAKFLSRPGIKTDVFVRFSTVIHPRGSPETLRDPRGFSIKFYTETEGNFDIVGNNLPVFFIRDHIKFPDLVHSLSPDPVTNLQDPNRFFDFFAALGGQATHMVTYLFSDLGIPANFRTMVGNSVHAYKFVNSRRQIKYVKFRWFTNQGVKNLTAAEAQEIQGKDFAHATGDLYDAIRRGDFPTWDFSMQVMDPSRLKDFDFNPLDATKEWPEDEFPFIKIGELVLNRIPDNFYLESEQSAFDPGNYLPAAIEPSEDRLFQGRLVSYHESATHRLGSNFFNRLPINRPKNKLRTYNQDGVMAFEHDWSGSINYEPSMNPNVFKENPRFLYSTLRVCGLYEQQSISKTLNFRQAGELFQRFSARDQDNLISNLSGALGAVRNRLVRETMCAHFYKADPTYGRRISTASNCRLRVVRQLASKLRE